MKEIEVSIDEQTLQGFLTIPNHAVGLILFAHGSGSGRKSPRNQFVAQHLNNQGLGTFLFDLLTFEEEKIDATTSELRFNIPFLSQRLETVTHWAEKNHSLPIGYFGASTGAAAALTSATKKNVKAIVCRGGRPDLAQQALAKVTAPTLLIVGGLDTEVIELNKKAYKSLHCTKQMEIVPGASHLFEEPGKLEIVAELSTSWFLKY